VERIFCEWYVSIDWRAQYGIGAIAIPYATRALIIRLASHDHLAA
jgi:hypothetical protein